MNQARTTRTRAILREYGYRPRKGRGQHFLAKENLLRRIAQAADIKPSETVVEIGAGPGNLTKHLVKKAARVVAVELEPELCSILKAELPAENLEILQQDVLDLDFQSLAERYGKLKVVANLPYNISTETMFKFLDTPELFSELVLLLQLEVAERITAKPGAKPYGILAARAQLLADCEIIFRISPSAFIPPPKVHSALVRMEMLSEPRFPVANLETYSALVKAVFARRRKTLKNSFFSPAPDFSREAFLEAASRAGIDLSRRAETLTIEELAAISREMRAIINRGGAANA